jgi:RNA polymerase sigma-B factor
VRDDERERFREYRATGDRRLRNRLVEDNQQLVEPFVRRFEGRGMPTDDLRQMALLAVLKAVERFDPEMGVAFSTFAGRTIDGELKRFLRDRSWTVRPPRRQQETFLAVRRTQDEMVQALGRAPTIAELAEAVEISEDHVLEALEAGGARHATSIDQPSPTTGAPDPDRLLGGVDASYPQVDVRMLVDGLLEGLDERERAVITLRFYDELGQPEIAERLGLSQSYVSRLIRQVLSTLRAQLDAGEVDVAEPPDPLAP